MNKTIKIVGILMICFMILGYVGNVSANVANYDMQLTTQSTTIDLNTQKEVTIYLKLTEFNIADTMLGYEAVLDYDETVFSNVTVTGMNDWIGMSSSNDIYNSETKKLVSTTGSAKSGTNVAKLVFTIQSGIEPQNTTISLNDLLISTGSEDEQSASGVVRMISLNLQKNETEPTPEEDNNEENNGQDNNQNENNEQNNNNNNQENNDNVGNNNNQNNEQGSVNPDDEEETPQTNRVNTSTNEGRANITVTPTDNTQAGGSIPQTGSNTQILGAIMIIAILGIIMYIRYRSIEIK